MLRSSNNNVVTITDEMIVKTLFNLFYLGIMYWYIKGVKDNTNELKTKDLKTTTNHNTTTNNLLKHNRDNSDKNNNPH